MRSREIPSAEITPKQVYLSRRQFMMLTAVAVAGTALAACGVSTETAEPDNGLPTDEAADILTPRDEIINNNNYYEFTTDKQDVAALAKNFRTSPWEIEVSGLVDHPGKFSLDDLLKKYPPQEHVYRLRCVEAWSMVIPWMGFPLSDLLRDTGLKPDAKFVRFESVYRPDEMPGQKQITYPWPYQEGLRLDEAMHDLTLLATGIYGGELPAQCGGGIRLVVPWKYGFKSIKAVVKIELTAEQPETFWHTLSPSEYGFYANVNPQVDHPRWSQRLERRIGEDGLRETLLFNGYSDQVAGLYDDLDLNVNY